MKAVILAGGFGTRLSEETSVRPKPMVEIGGKPLLWHIMKTYSHHGVSDFVVCLGYRGYVVKEYFANYSMHMSDVTFDLGRSAMTVHQRYSEPWRVTLIDTGAETLTGGRLKRVREHLDDGTFLMTYGDGVADVDITATIAHHRTHGRAATLTATQPPGRFGRLVINEGDRVDEFEEKPEGDGAWINGGFFVLEPSVLDYVDGDESSWESDALPRIAMAGQLTAYRHHGFWQPMDTLRDKQRLEELWSSGRAPWQIWSQR